MTKDSTINVAMVFPIVKVQFIGFNCKFDVSQLTNAGSKFLMLSCRMIDHCIEKVIIWSTKSDIRSVPQVWNPLLFKTTVHRASTNSNINFSGQKCNVKLHLAWNHTLQWAMNMAKCLLPLLFFAVMNQFFRFWIAMNQYETAGYHRHIFRQLIVLKMPLKRTKAFSFQKIPSLYQSL